MASARFDELQETIEQRISNLKEALLALPSASKDGKGQINAECLQLGRSIDKDLRAMEAETKVSTPKVRRAQQDVIAQLRKDYVEATQKLQRLNDSIQRSELLPQRSAEVRPVMIILSRKLYSFIHPLLSMPLPPTVLAPSPCLHY